MHVCASRNVSALGSDHLCALQLGSGSGGNASASAKDLPSGIVSCHPPFVAVLSFMFAV